MTERYAVRLTKERFTFSAAHFITFDSATRERLHGHNYGVAAEVHGPLGESSYVVDFIKVRDALQSIVADLDHRVLLPGEHPQIQVTRADNEIIATFGDVRWVFPEDDCVVLPVANTTAELLARFIGLRLGEELSRDLGRGTQLRVEIDECEGQIACWLPCS